MHDGASLHIARFSVIGVNIYFLVFEMYNAERK